MGRINTIAEAEEALALYIPKVREMFGKDITLDRTERLMEQLDHPEEKLKIIHIAGTSGKTSTAYYISSMLHNSGKKVGLTVSPHIDSITERVQINGQPISERDFCESLEEFLGIVESSNLEPTYFEVLIAFAYWYFAKENVDYAVIETGIGGLHDSTNVASREDKICVITDIGFDHMNVLGNTIEEIAAQKAGIIYEHNQVFMYDQGEEVNNVFKKQAELKQASIAFINPNETAVSYPWIEAMPLFQQRNWTLAYLVVKHIAQKDNFVLKDGDLEKSADLSVPGRMNVVSFNGKKIILDGAHNDQKMEMFIKSFLEQFPDQKVPILFSIKERKEFEDVLPLLVPIASEIFLTEFSVYQDRHNMSADLEEMASLLKEKGFNHVTIEHEQNKAYRKFLAAVKENGIVTGSFYLIAQLRKEHEELKHG